MTQDSIIERVTVDYCSQINRDNIKSLADFDTYKDELLSKVHEAFDEHNVLCAKDEKWKKPSTLFETQVAWLINSIFVVKRIRIGNDDLSDGNETDILTVYVDELVILAAGEKYRDRLGTYQRSEDLIRDIIRKFNFIANEHFQRETLTALKNITSFAERCTDPDLIPVNNGIFNFKTKECMEFTPEYVFLCKSPINYNPVPSNKVFSVNGGTWDIESWMDGLSDDPEVVKYLWMVLSALLRPRMPWDVSCWLLSPRGANGKGTYLMLAKNLLGGSYASLNLAQFSKEFMLESLVGKTAVLCDENPVGTYIDKADDYKACVTGDTIQMNRKFKTPIVYDTKGMFIIQCFNEIPRIKDKSDSFYRRILVIPMDKCYTGIANKEIKSKFVYDNDVLEYVLHKILHMDFYEMPIPQFSKDKLDEVKMDNDYLRLWWDEVREQFVWSLLPWDFLYQCYVSFYQENTHKNDVIGSTTFKNQLCDILISTNDDLFCCPDKNKLYRVTKDNMDGPEPLIARYHLDFWKAKTYKGNDIKKMCVPALADRYRGLIRIGSPMDKGTDVETE